MSKHRRSGARHRLRVGCQFTPEGLEPRRLLSASQQISTFDPTTDGFTPALIRHAYGFDQTTFGTIPADGRGQTIAIVDAQDNPTIQSDLSTFDAQFGLAAPPSFKVVSQRGGSDLPVPDPGWASEITLDVEWSHAIAPMANILLVETDSQDWPNLMAGVDYARHQAGVSVVSMSFGGNEFFQFNGGEGDQRQFDPVFFTPAGHAGVTFVAAAGDHTSQAGVLWPAASPSVLTVGGTTLTLKDQAGTYGNEVYWSGTNSGYSNLELEPSYQQGVQQTGYRMSPDVTYNADPATGFAVFSDFAFGGWLPGGIGGTSAGAPQWSALLAIVNQGRALHGLSSLDGATQTLPILYSLYAPPFSPGYSTYTRYFTDVNEAGSPVVTWRWGGTAFNDNIPIQGFDTATGLGSPKAAALIPALATLSAPPPSPLIGSVIKGPPAAVRGGDPGVLKLRLTNTATTLFDQPVSVNLYAAPMSGAGSTPIGSFPVGTVDLKPNKGKNVTLKFTYPAGMPRANYQLIAAIVPPESNSVPNQVKVTPPVTIAPPTVDLAATSPTGQVVLVRPGSQSTALVDVQNVGNVTASGIVNLTLYASKDRALDPSDTQLPAVPGFKIRIRPGHSMRLHVRFWAPTNLAGGSYFVLASMTSSTDPADANAANNVAVIPTRAS